MEASANVHHSSVGVACQERGADCCGSVGKAGDRVFFRTGHKGKKEMLLGIDAQHKTKPTTQQTTNN